MTLFGRGNQTTLHVNKVIRFQSVSRSGNPTDAGDQTARNIEVSSFVPHMPDVSGRQWLSMRH